MMPRLLAEESLRAAERVAVGTGSLKPGAGARVLSRWRRESRPAGTTKARSPEMLAAMGVKVRVVPRRAEARVDG